jgi:hypothetical protein
MPRRMSNSERIARARAEATATEKEKAVKKAAKKAVKKTAKKTTRTRKAATPERRMLVWAVGKYGAEPVCTYNYKDKESAEADASGRGKGWTVKGIKVPMEFDEDE